MPEEQRSGIDNLEAENARLREEIAELRAEVDRLRSQVAEFKAKLNTSSQNSSASPSSDSPGKKAEARKKRSERRREERTRLKAEVRRRGKQPGAPGKTLPMRDDPDEVVPHEPSQCRDCGKDLSDADHEGVERRQVFDTLHPKLICTEHQGVRRRCACGTVTTGDFPPEARAPASYGPNVRANACTCCTASTSPSSAAQRRCLRCSA
ncbi:MAG: FtsB family cell division protein [Acidimicrobiales bacterium]